MSSAKFNEQFANLVRLAVDLTKSSEADALLVMVEGPVDWEQLKKSTGGQKVILAGDSAEELESAKAADFETVVLNMPDAPISEKLTQALLESVADDILDEGADVVAVYSAFDAGKGVGQIDSLSFLRLDEHLSRLTARDLRKLETQVPLDTLKIMLDLAVAIGREGREGKAVGTMFVVGDHRNVLESSRPIGFDPVYGYKRKERNLRDSRVREAVKEIAPLDGAFVISADGTILRACQLLETGVTAGITVSKGLGTRHWAAAAITKKTKAIAVVVSESNGTVRLFQNGEVVLRVEPFRRAMTWKEFDPDSPFGGASEDERR